MITDSAFAYLVTEGQGIWEPVAIYESLEDAKTLEPAADWRTDDRGMTVNWGQGRDLFIQRVRLVRSGQGLAAVQRD